MAHDNHHSAAAAHRGRLAVVFAITVALLLVEVAGAAISGSLALLADAGHVLADGAGVGLALLAIRFAARPATPQRTFGYYRLEILAAVVNAVLLFGVAGFVLVEAWRRLTEPPEVASGLMLAVAARRPGRQRRLDVAAARRPARQPQPARGLPGGLGRPAGLGGGAGGGRGDRPHRLPGRRPDRLGRDRPGRSCPAPGGCSARRSTSCWRRPPRGSTWTRSAGTW